MYFVWGHQETQTELVMFILLRLAEDVVTFQTLPTQRRRDIQQTLTQNMEKIFSFLLTTLQQNVNKYRHVVKSLSSLDSVSAGGIWELGYSSEVVGETSAETLKSIVVAVR